MKRRTWELHDKRAMGVLEETVFNVATQLRFDVLNRAADRFVRTLCVSASAACRAWS